MQDDLDNVLTLNDVYMKLKQQIKESENEITSKLEKLTSKLKEAEDKITTLEKQNDDLKKQLLESSKERKRNNIIIFGIKEEEEEDLYKIVLNFFGEKLERPTSKSQICNIYRFGKETNNSRPIVVKFVTLHNKYDILKQGYLLKDSQISIANDLIKQDRENQKILRRHCKQAKIQQLDAKIKNNKLIINGAIYTVEDLLKLEKRHEQEQVEVVENTPEKHTPEVKQVEKQLVKTKNIKRLDTKQEKNIATSSDKTSEIEIKSRIIYGLRSGESSTVNSAGTSSGKQRIGKSK